MSIGAVPDGDVASAISAESVLAASVLLVIFGLVWIILRLIRVIDRHWTIHHPPERASDKILARLLHKEVQPESEKEPD